MRGGLSCPVPGVGHTQALRLSKVESMAREMIALTIDVDVDEDDVAMEIDIAVPEDAQAHIDQARLLRVEAARKQAEAAREASASAAVLRRDGMTVREIGQLLGVSHQRAQQLLDVQRGGGRAGADTRPPCGKLVVMTILTPACRAEDLQ